MQPECDFTALVERVRAVPRRHKRRLIALAGAPASGKSTLADHLAQALPEACVVPMDGFHLDNRILRDRQLLPRKGAPETFDVAGFSHLLNRLRREDGVVYPLFDRALDCAVAGAGHVDGSVDTVIVEGNYLLLDDPGWRHLRELWDFAIFLAVPEGILRARLEQRWRDHGFSETDARRKIETNDLPNALRTARHILTPDLIVKDLRL